MDTFVVGELRKQATWLDDVGPVVPWRSSEGDDVDLTVERDETAVVAFPATTSTACASCATRSGNQFLAGVAFYLGERRYTSVGRPHVLPAHRLWLA